MLSSFLRFVDITRLTTVGRTPLSEWSTRRRNIYIYMTTHNKQKKKKIHPIKALEHTISKTVWPKITASDRTATMTVIRLLIISKYLLRYSSSQLQLIYRDVFIRLVPVAIKFNFFLITWVSPLRTFLSCGPDTHHGAWSTHSWGLWITQNDAPQFVGLLWASDQLVAVISSWQLTTLEKK